MVIKKIARILSTASLMLAATAAHAGFTGHTVSADYIYPTIGTVYLSSGTAVVGAGVEFDNIGGFGVGLSPSADFTDTTISVLYPVGFVLNGSGTFDGWAFTDFSAATITGVTLGQSSVPGLAQAMLSFDSSHVYVNTLGLGSWGPGTGFSLNVSFAAAAVPEPASWALMIAGLGVAGAAMRRRQTIAFA